MEAGVLYETFTSAAATDSTSTMKVYAVNCFEMILILTRRAENLLSKMEA
jgi:hypothetical protein